MLQGLQSTRAMLRGHTAAAQDVIEFAVPHTLALTFFPSWVSALRENFSPIKSRLIALNVHDAMLRLVEGSCDLLMVYHHEAQPIALDPERYEMVVLGEESQAFHADAVGKHLTAGGGVDDGLMSSAEIQVTRQATPIFLRLVSAIVARQTSRPRSPRSCVLHPFVSGQTCPGAARICSPRTPFRQ